MSDTLSQMQNQEREHLSHIQKHLLTTSFENISIDLYKELLVAYLILSKINEAKFLWENLSPNMKTDKEFQYLASLVCTLNLKQYGDFYKLCQTALETGSTNPISSQISQSIQQLVSRVTIENVELIELAYKSISFDDIQKMFGLNRKTVEQICNERNWQIDVDGIHLLPKRNDKLSAASNSNLAKLVELVCFLER